MQRAVTAIYRSFDVANLVRDELERLGIPRDHITVLPDTAELTGSADVSRSATPPGPEDDDYRTNEYRALQQASERLRLLHLSEDDTRTYQQALRSGDYVVLVSVNDETNFDRIEEIMRRGTPMI